MGVPIFGDQMMNMARAELLGWGVQVLYTNLTETSFSWALNEALTNKKYQINVDKIKNRLLDQPQTPMEKAMFWIEYVIRHDGAHFMQTSAQHLSFIEYNNLDIYGTLLAVLILAIYVPIWVIRKIIKRILCKPCLKTKQKRS